MEIELQVKAVLFDLGGTLIKTAEIPEIFRRILGTCGLTVSFDQILEAHEANKREFDATAGQIEFGNEFWNKWDLKILKRLGINKNAEFLAKKIDELWWDSAELELHSDVMDTLTWLRAKDVKTGIVTNALKKDYEQILRKLKATDLFGVVVGIDACRKAKPDAEIFLFAVKNLGVKPKETIFIGDSLREDYEGAEKAGLKPLLICREGKLPPNVEAITKLTEVFSYVPGS